MSSIDQLWKVLEFAGEPSGVRRVDESHPCDLYAGLDGDGRRGLILITDAEPPAPLRLSSVDVVVARRHDGRWSVAMWLEIPALIAPFTRLCQDLIDATRGDDPRSAAMLLLTRLAWWRRLLERESASLSLSELRGLAGELVVLGLCMERWPPAEAIDAWVGPLEAPQDFALPGLLIETKAVTPTAVSVRITSADQLDASGRLLLAVVTLATVSVESAGAPVAALVGQIRARLNDLQLSTALLEFDSRLAALGYSEEPAYEDTRFRVDEVRFFEVREGFPRLQRRHLPIGVAEVLYDIERGAIEQYETELPD